MLRISEGGRSLALGMPQGGMKVSRKTERQQVYRSTISGLVARHRAIGRVRDRPRSGQHRVMMQLQNHHIGLQDLQDLQDLQQQVTETPGADVALACIQPRPVTI